ISKDLFCQIHRHGTGGNITTRDRSRRAYLFTYLKRFLKKSIQELASRLCTNRKLVSTLDLAKNFRFANGHRFQTRSYLKQVTNTVISAQAEQMRFVPGPEISIEGLEKSRSRAVPELSGD